MSIQEQAKPADESLRPVRTIVKWKLSALKPHPRQNEFYLPRTPEELRELADAIRVNGLNAIEILPDGTIVCGHSRVEAVRLLGWEEIDAIVRNDLAAQSDEAVEAWLLEDNRNRRQQTPLTTIRIVTRQVQLYKERNRYANLDLHVEIQRHLKMDRRNITRYLNILRTPHEVQAAFEAGKLPLVDADKVSRLSKDQQEAIAAEIRNGDDPKKVVKAYLTKKDSVPEPVEEEEEFEETPEAPDPEFAVPDLKEEAVDGRDESSATPSSVAGWALSIGRRLTELDQRAERDREIRAEIRSDLRQLLAVYKIKFQEAEQAAVAEDTDEADEPDAIVDEDDTTPEDDDA